jgi:hypothetical protein
MHSDGFELRTRGPGSAEARLVIVAHLRGDRHQRMDSGAAASK